MTNTRLLVVVIVLQALTLAGQWLGGQGYVTSAHAQVADPGRDRIQMLDEQRSTNVKLDKLIELLRSGDLQVKVVQSDETKGRATAR